MHIGVWKNKFHLQLVPPDFALKISRQTWPLRVSSHVTGQLLKRHMVAALAGLAVCGLQDLHSARFKILAILVVHCIIFRTNAKIGRRGKMCRKMCTPPTLKLEDVEFRREKEYL